MTLKFYNTLTRKKEEFKEKKKGHISMYTCGPTSYHYSHIGNLRSFIFVDLLKRYLIYKKYKVKHVMNITDVDDKTIRDSKKAKKSLKEFTEFYEKEFFTDLETLNIQKADIYPRAKDHIKDMVKLIEKLNKNKLTYTSKDSTYFKISKFENYGKLASLDKQTLKQNADGRLNTQDEYDKENVQDFALWKAYNKEDGDVFWETKIGKGRPGWHIECSAMSMKYLGENFDIHTGGIDLIFPHHTNEIAQSEAATGKKFVNYWLHNAHLIVNGEKMSKSKGNFFTLRDLQKKGYHPLAIRYELLSTHYRQQLDFREKDMESASNTLKKFSELFHVLDDAKENAIILKVDKLIKNVKEKFEKEMDDDLNISGALSAIFVFIRGIHKLKALGKKDANNIKNTLLDLDQVLGVMNYKKEKIPREIENLAKQRLEARNNKDWTLSDDLRNKIKKLGYQIDDTEKGFIIKKIN